VTHLGFATQGWRAAGLRNGSAWRRNFIAGCAQVISEKLQISHVGLTGGIGYKHTKAAIQLLHELRGTDHSDGYLQLSCRRPHLRVCCYGGGNQQYSELSSHGLIGV
jgi:hypothetical protein